MSLYQRNGSVFIRRFGISANGVCKSNKLDPSTGEVLASFTAPENSWPYDLAFDGTYLWAVDKLYDKVYKLDPANCEVLDSFDGPARDPAGLPFDGTHLWISDTSPVITSIRRTDGLHPIPVAVHFEFEYQNVQSWLQLRPTARLQRILCAWLYI